MVRSGSLGDRKATLGERGLSRARILDADRSGGGAELEWVAAESEWVAVANCPASALRVGCLRFPVERELRCFL